MNRPSAIEPPDLWERDGSFRDVYVFGTSLADWASLMRVARRHHATYRFEGAETELPELAAIFANREGGHLLQIDLAGVQVNCHFLVPEEIEMDIDPRQVSDASRHKSVILFLEELALEIQKPLALTLENAPELPCLTFDPKAGAWTVHPVKDSAT